MFFASGGLLLYLYRPCEASVLPNRDSAEPVLMEAAPFIRKKSAAQRIWRVFYTMARAEKKCEDRLEEAGIEVLVPKCLVVRQWKDRKKKVVEPLFNNYLFAHVDERERLDVLQTSGIVRCVSFGGVMAALTDREVEQLVISQRDPSRLSLLTVPLPAVGALVTVEEGPMRGMVGKVIEHRGQDRLVLAVDVPTIRQAFRVVIAASEVRAEDQRFILK